MKLWANGWGGTTGDSLATAKPVYMSGDVWFVNSATGSDSAAPRGKDRQAPLATLAQAQTNAANGDVVVLMDGHTETFTVGLSLTKALCIVGEGLSSGIPTVQLKINSANQSCLVLSTAGIELRNIRFPASILNNAGAGGNVGKVAIAANSCFVIGCYIEQALSDQLPGISLANAVTNIRLENTTIISTAISGRAAYGLYHIGTVTDLDVVGCVFSDGTLGFTGAAWDGTAGAVTRLRAQGISQLLGAAIRMNASTVGRINPATVTNGGEVNW